MIMKILLVHTYYQLRGGEDNVFEQEIKLLSQGHNVITKSYKNFPGLKGALQFFCSIWNYKVFRSLYKEILEIKPDIVHIHNWHYAIGPIAIRASKKAKVPVIITLHNYRLLCPSATLLIGDKLFLDSLNQNFPWKAIFKKAYRNSIIQTFWLAFIIWFHKKIGTWNQVSCYITLTPFAKQLYIDSNFNVDAQKLQVKPNFVERPNLNPVPRQEYFLFIGRLYEEKGINVLLKAFQNSPYELHIAGDGNMKEEVLAACNSRIKYIGNLNKEQVLQAMQQCTALIFPSIWYEGMPMTMLEAFSMGTPVITSNLGAMSSIVQHLNNGLHFEVNDASSLCDQIEYWSNLSSDKKLKFQENALISYMNLYAPEKNLTMLEDIYQQSILSK